MLKRAALFLSIFCLGALYPAYADQQDTVREQELAQIAAVLKPSVGLSARFTQERIIPILSQPLMSGGHITIPREGELVWVQDTPYAVTLKFTADGMTEILADGQEQTADNPMVSSMGQIFISLLSGDPVALSAYFTVVEADIDEAAWFMKLKPHDDLLSTAIERIEISGQVNVESVTVWDSQGGKSHIVFSEHGRGAPQ